MGNDIEITYAGWMTIGHTDIAELLNKKLDIVIIDLQHSAINIEQAYALIKILKEPYVRIASIKSDDIEKLLDFGISGIIVPQVENDDDAKTILSHIYYKPRGIRSVGIYRGQKWVSPDNTQYPKIFFQLESIAGIEWAMTHMDRYKNDISGFIFGMYDLMQDSDNDKDTIDEYRKQLMTEAKRHSVDVGIHIVFPDYEKIERAINDGFTFIIVGTDYSFIQKGMELLDDIK